MIYNLSPLILWQWWHYGSIKSHLSKQKLIYNIWQKLVLTIRAAWQNDLLLCEEQRYSLEFTVHSLIRQMEIHQQTGIWILLKATYLRSLVGWGPFVLFPLLSLRQRINSENFEEFIAMHRREIYKKNWNKFSFTALMTT